MNKSKILTIIAFIFLVVIVLLIILVKMGLFNNGLGKSNKKVDFTQNTSSTDKNEEEEKIKYTETISVYNAAEYMDVSTIRDFEKEYKIRVNYFEFESNESMYKDITTGSNSYDILVPSDYMVDRLIKEDRIEKIDKANITNLSNVAEEYLYPEYDKENDYIVPYMTGTLGILYNKKIVTETVDSWNIMWNEKYKGQIWLWDSLRDVLAMSMKKLGYSVNTANDDELNQVKQELINQTRLLRSFGEEESRDAMIADEGALALVYSGEAKFAIDQNPNLAYVIPKEGSNKFVDGFVIVKGTKHKDAAEKFINFMCRSNIAVRNMTSTGYTSPIKGAWNEFGNNSIMFPSQEELDRCEAFMYDPDGTEKYNALWKSIR